MKFAKYLFTQTTKLWKDFRKAYRIGPAANL